MMPHRVRGAAGFTLIEMLVTIGITASILTLGGICFAEIIRLRGAQNRYFVRLQAADHLLRRIERDVRAAHAFAGSAGEFDAGDHTLIVVSHDGTIVYRWEQDRMVRVVRRGDGSHRSVVTIVPGMTVGFDLEAASPAQAHSVVTTVEWDEHPKIGVSHPILSLRVALRNSAHAGLSAPAGE